MPAVLANYWWVIPASSAIWFLLGAKGDVPSLVAVLGVIYFIQQQRVREFELFHRLFREFNDRYDRHNDRLQRLVGGTGKLTISETTLLTDYFNLCAEEYFYYSQGVIPGIVWRAWCKGISAYVRDERIGRFWDQEEATGSYYGLTRDLISEGAGQSPSGRRDGADQIREMAA